MTDHLNLAVVGATSLKGEAFVAKLSGIDLELGEIFLLDDETKAGEHVEYNRKDKLVLSASSFDFAKVQHVVLVGDAALTEQVYPAIEAAACAVIDASGFLGQTDDVSLATLQEEYETASIVAIPEASTLQLWMILQGLLLQTSISALHVSVMQCAAQAGAMALEELGQQTARLLSFQDAKPSCFDKQLAFNLIPQVGEISENGDTASETVIKQQVSRLFAMPKTDIDVTMMWSSVFFGDVLTVNLQMDDDIALEHLTEEWQANPLLTFAANDLQTPVTEASGKSTIGLSRLRYWQTSEHKTQLSFCSMADPVQLSATACLLILKNQLVG